jgi:hypothetical protein
MILKDKKVTYWCNIVFFKDSTRIESRLIGFCLFSFLIVFISVTRLREVVVFWILDIFDGKGFYDLGLGLWPYRI